MRAIIKSTTLAAIASACLVFSGCGEKDKDDDEDKAAEEEAARKPGGAGTGATPGVITMSGSLALDGTALTADSLSDLILYCVTFEATPTPSTSGFDATGAFSVVIKANTPFGCFVNDKNTNKTKATFIVEAGISDGIGEDSASSLALSGDVDLGALVLGSTGEIKIPAAKIADKKTAPVSAIDLDQVHNSTYKMECLDIGNAENLAACIAMLQDDNNPLSVYFRVIKGTKGTDPVLGLGVWQDQTSFENCGSFDMTAAQQEKITSEGYVLSQVAAGAFAGENCAKRDDQKDFEQGNIKNYYAFSRLIPTAAGYSFFEESEDTYNNCKNYHSTAIEFAGTTAEMIGAFASKEIQTGTCGDGEKNEQGVFNVKFVKQ